MHVHLRNKVASVVFNFVDDTISITHWGKPLKAIDDASISAVATRPLPHGGLDVMPKNLIWREHSRGWAGRPSIQGHRSGKSSSNWFVLKSHEATTDSLEANFEDKVAGLSISVTYKLDSSGVLLIDSKLTNIADGDYVVDQFINWLPLPEQADEVLDFYGRWSKERQPQRREINYGLTTRESFEGRSGHEYTIIQIALNNKCSFNSGEAWSMGVAWSGHNVHHVERLIDGNRSIGAGEQLLPGEVILAKGESYQAPTVVASYSSAGLDGITDNHYQWIRAKKTSKMRPRPLTLNMWEAIHFDHSFDRIKGIVDKAAEVGVERVVLDDGWFGARRDDRQGLGDWVVSKDVWPHGLRPLADYVGEKGMEFGLWFEGEMVQRDSDLFRAHPDWILQEDNRWPVEGRRQQVLDLTKPDAYAHVLNQIDAILKSCKISYIKWDHNRPITDPISNGRPAVRNQTLAIYRMFDELKDRNPGLEIESCSSGGGRIDLGMIDHAERFWTSDQNDALERQQIQRWTAMAIPPEMLGTHIGPTLSLQTHRTNNISFRAISALFGHAGIEWDITKATDSEIATLKEFARFYKENRGLLHSGRVSRSDVVDGNAILYGTVSHDKKSAIFSYMQLQTMNNLYPVVAQLPGLDPERTYTVKVIETLSAPTFEQKKFPNWWPKVQVRGAVLAEIGLELPVIRPEQGLLVRLDS